METIQIGMHPYAFNIDVKFGTFDEMIKNAKSLAYWDGYQIHLGGNFNTKMEKECGRRASFLEIGVHLELKDYDKPVTEDNVESASAVSFCHWEGVYWKCSYFDEQFKKGLWPVSADWDGKTYIERWRYKGKDKNGIPIADKPYYERTDTFRF